MSEDIVKSSASCSGIADIRCAGSLSNDWDVSSFANNDKSSLGLVWLDKQLVEEFGDGNHLRLCHNFAPARDRTAGRKCVL
ncbi:hypothetical protein pipiens_019550 [Culex pipiens pipiens]|uniref:Uncharacterized protein n=1 Tax=Culex pipiens pipiens TaxID=38569 RepID=A0ABD1DTU1_CULPP